MDGGEGCANDLFKFDCPTSLVTTLGSSHRHHSPYCFSSVITLVLLIKSAENQFNVISTTVSFQSSVLYSPVLVQWLSDCPSFFRFKNVGLSFLTKTHTSALLTLQDLSI